MRTSTSHPTRRSLAARCGGIACLAFLLLAPATPAQDDREAFKIQWHDRTFYTDEAMPELAADLTFPETPEPTTGYYFVQFTGPITPEMKRQATEAGAELLSYVPNNAYLARLEGADRRRVEELEVVRWVGVYQPAFRMPSGLAERLTADPTAAPPPPPSPPTELEIPAPPPPPSAEAKAQLTVTVFRGEDLDRVRRQVEAAGGEVVATSEGELRSRLRVVVPADRVRDLAFIEGVAWIEEYVAPTLDNDAGRSVMGTAAVWSPPNDLRGDGQIVAVSDTGLDSGANDASMHDDFEGRIVSIFSWPVQASLGVTNVGADDGASDLDSGHGTHVAGSVLGDGTVSGGTFAGNAPHAQLVFQAVEQWTDRSGTANDGYRLSGIPNDLNDLFQQSYDAGARIQTNSWGAPVAGDYDARAIDVDEFVWNHPDMLILYSAGNEGSDPDGDGVINADSIGSPGTCKNCLTVGASENDRATIPQSWTSRYGAPIHGDRVADAPEGMAAFSSRGPTDDGRIKPDLTAPGTAIVSTRTQAAANAVWFTDDVEGGVGGWTAGGSWARVATDSHSPGNSWHDSPAGDYAANVNAVLTSEEIALNGGGLGGKTVQFWCRYDLGDGDRWRLEVSGGGSSGALEFTGDQPDWELLSIGLGPFSNDADFRLGFRLVGDGDASVGDGLYVDDVRIVEGAFGGGLLSDYGLEAAGTAVDDSYVFLRGTSMSTPLTAGAAALVRQYYTETEGLGYVSAALLRATLINGAVDMSPGQYGVGAAREMGEKPNNVEGWGRVNVERSLFPASPAELDWIDELAGLGTGDSRDYTLEVTDASVPIAVTMVYHDFPGTSGAPLVNDLDLRITAPGGGTTYFPNGLAAADPDNNVEQVVIPAADVVVGSYTVTVAAPSVPEGPQPYALVTSAGGRLTDRDPVDVALVLDYSGSMGSPACPTCDPKHVVLKDAVEIFIQLWTALAVPADRLGVTFFRTAVDELEVGGEELLPVIAHAPALIAAVRGEGPDDLTAMGGGLQTAIDRLADATRPRSVILFTDGMQNVNPMVLEVAGHLEIDDDGTGRPDSGVAPTVPPTRLDPALDRKVNTIGVGANDPWVALLEEIAADTGGVTKVTLAADDDLRRFYVEELVDVLRDFSPQLIAYRQAAVGRDGTATESFRVDRGARQLVLKLSWRRGVSLDFRVEKDGRDVTHLGEFIDGGPERQPFYRIFTVDLPARDRGGDVGPEGVWTMRITGPAGASYDAAAIADEPQLDYRFSVGGSDHRVGEPIELSARLSVDGGPVIDARKVTATVYRPGTGLGTLLSTTDPAPVQTATVQAAAEQGATVGQKKLQALLLDPKLYPRLRPEATTVTLRNRGDGSYAGSFGDTTVPGSYRVVFEVEGSHPELGEYRRSETVSTLVELAGADLSASRLRLHRPAEPNDLDPIALYLRPRDRRGNYLGPDYGQRIRVEVTPGQVGRIEDLGDGSYRVPLSGIGSGDPRIEVRVMDEPLYDGPASGIEGGFRLSLHLGVTEPFGDFDRAFDGDALYELDVEKPLRSRLSLRGVLGLYRFDPGFDVVGGTVYLRGYLPRPGGFRLFAEVGGGLYDPDVLDLAFGLSAGVGVDRALGGDWRGELGADVFHLFNQGDDVEFLVFKVGLSRRF